MNEKFSYVDMLVRSVVRLVQKRVKFEEDMTMAPNTFPTHLPMNVLDSWGDILPDKIFLNKTRAILDDNESCTEKELTTLYKGTNALNDEHTVKIILDYKIANSDLLFKVLFENNDTGTIRLSNLKKDLSHEGKTNGFSTVCFLI